MGPLLNASNWNPAAVVTSSNQQSHFSSAGLSCNIRESVLGGSGFIFHGSPVFKGRPTFTKQVVLLVSLVTQM